jgi:hypothetical protein
MRKSILFVHPDFHCSFVCRDELRKLGWKADIYVNENYPEKLLYSSEDIIAPPFTGNIPLISRGLRLFWRLCFVMYICLRYKYHFCYSGLDPLSFAEKKLGFTRFFGESFRFYLSMAKTMGCKIVQTPSGCKEEETKENFGKFDDGNVCNNCGWGEKNCNDEKNIASFNIVRRYADMVVSPMSTHTSNQFKLTFFRYKSIDLNLWRPGLEIPEKHQQPETRNLRILHSFFDTNRNHGGKNIKGSPFILAAIDRLKEEGHPVEYIFLRDTPSRDMRFYQAQADIVVEQLIYGWWGSTGVETMSLGKPVVCYLRPSWKKFFLKKFPEYTALPIVEANTQTIYEVLKKLVTDKKYRENKGRESRDFAEQHYDVKRNTRELASILEKL